MFSSAPIGLHCKPQPLSNVLQMWIYLNKTLYYYRTTTRSTGIVAQTTSDVKEVRQTRIHINLLWSIVAIWWSGSESTRVQVRACLWHQAITWNNVDLSLSSSYIHPRAISQEKRHPTITKISVEIIHKKFHSNFPGGNKLITAVVLKCTVSRIQGKRH